MAKAPLKDTARAGDDGFASRKRRSPLTDYLDASEPLDRGGFEEAPQADLTGSLHPQAEPPEVLADALQALAIDVQGHQLCQLRLALQQVCGLATGGGTGIQNSLARPQVKTFDSSLCGCILNGHSAFGKARQTFHRARRLDAQRIRQIRVSVTMQALIGAILGDLRHRRMTSIQPQPQWRQLIVGLQQHFGFFRPGLTQCGNPPARMFPTCHLVFLQGGQQRILFAQEASQQSIDQPSLTLQAQSAGLGHGFGDCRVRWSLQVQQLRQSAQEQCVQQSRPRFVRGTQQAAQQASP